MNRASRFVLWAVAVLVVAMVALGLGRNALLGTAAVRAVRDSAGLDLRIDRIRTRLMHPRVEVEGLVIANPAGFLEPEALHCARISARYNRSSLFSREVLFDEMRIEIPRVSVVYDTNGVMNLRQLLEAVSEHRKTATPAAAKVHGGGGGGGGGRRAAAPGAPEPRTCRIGVLTVAVGAVEVRDHTAGKPPPEVRAMDVKVEYSMTNVTDFAQAGREIGIVVGVAAAPVLIHSTEDALRLIGADSKQADQAAEKLKDGARDLKRLWDELRGKKPSKPRN